MRGYLLLGFFFSQLYAFLKTCSWIISGAVENYVGSFYCSRNAYSYIIAAIDGTSFLFRLAQFICANVMLFLYEINAFRDERVPVAGIFLAILCFLKICSWLFCFITFVKITSGAVDNSVGSFYCSRNAYPYIFAAMDGTFSVMSRACSNLFCN